MLLSSLRNRRLQWPAAVLSAYLLVASSSLGAATRYTPSFEPGYRPDPSTDEGGFWYQVDQIEKQLQQSPLLIQDENLQVYLRGIVCDLTPEHCPYIRIYVIDNPHFNASMYPNGMMHIWTGTLLRADSEAQLAAVIAHEIAHYLLSHQITQWRSLRNGLATALVFDTLLTMGFASLAVAGSSLSFSRRQETEADLFGLELMARAGYDLAKAHELWEYTIHEKESDESTSKSPGFWSTHPLPAKRAKYLADAYEALGDVEHAGRVGSDEYLRKVYPLYFDFMDNYLQMRDFGRTEVLLARHEALGYPAPLINHFQGELHRLRGGEGDEEKAIGFYKAAIADPDASAESFRELGYLLVKRRDPAAVQHLEAYKLRRSHASDLEMVNFYIQSLSQ